MSLLSSSSLKVKAFKLMPAHLGVYFALVVFEKWKCILFKQHSFLTATNPSVTNFTVYLSSPLLDMPGWAPKITYLAWTQMYFEWNIQQTTADVTTGFKRAGTHIILMQNLKDFVDIIESMNSGGASFFGLRKRKWTHKSVTAHSLANQKAAEDGSSS